MKPNVLKYFYRYNGLKNEFLKSYFIRVIRNKIIDPNTQNYLADGFSFYDEKTNEDVLIPSDDSNWCEFTTIKEGFENKVFQIPFTIKLHNNYFYTLDNYDEFIEIFKKMIDFRMNVIKRGWAIKYGLEFEDVKYPLLEDLNEEKLLNWVDPRTKPRYNLDYITEEMLLK